MKVTQLLHKNQFARAAQLAGSLGVAEASEDTIKYTAPLFPAPRVVAPADMMAYYGPPVNPLMDQPSPVISMAVVFTADVPTKTVDILSSATVLVLLKKEAAAMEERKRRLG